MPSTAAVMWFLPGLAAAAAASSPCAASTAGLVCDGATDDTKALQAALNGCTASGTPVTLPVGKTCISFPLVLPSHSALVVPAGAVLKAGKSRLWPNKTNASGLTNGAHPFITSGPAAVNLSLSGAGTIDGSGAQWWTGNNKTPNRPLLIELDAAGVLLQGLLLLNPAAWTTTLRGSDYRIFDIKIRTPGYRQAPNTDGLDIAAKGVHIRGADITNGDDSICMKSPAQDVLVESSTVRQGNGFVVGTSDDADFRNITFRNCTAIGTAFGIHIKFKDQQTGSVRDITFEDVTIVDPQRYAIGIDQNGQSLEGGVGRPDCHGHQLGRGDAPAVGSNVTVNDVHFRSVRATVGAGHKGGCFICNPGPLACRGITFDDVNLQVAGSQAGAACSFSNVFGTGSDVHPASCVPPNAEPRQIPAKAGAFKLASNPLKEINQPY